MPDKLSVLKTNRTNFSRAAVKETINNGIPTIIERPNGEPLAIILNWKDWTEILSLLKNYLGDEPCLIINGQKIEF